ncbi:hypothetical protein M9Y10_016142 [Tritrichomonas musculus]|uniref:Protein kinase domain-containing protein n=1 Tax=Tritrichomonas musculus TaxID=1915356 RepID=A0ABR2I5F1_9EUKA
MASDSILYNINRLLGQISGIAAKISINYLSQNIQEAILHEEFFTIDYSKFGERIINESTISDEKKDKIREKFKNPPKIIKPPPKEVKEEKIIVKKVESPEYHDFLTYYLENKKQGQIKYSEITTVRDLLIKLQNETNQEYENEKLIPDFDDNYCVYLKCKKLDDDVVLKDYIDELETFPLFISNDPTKAYDYHLSKLLVNLDDYDIQDYLEYDGWSIFFKAIDKKRGKQVIISSLVDWRNIRRRDLYIIRGLNVSCSLEMEGIGKIVGFKYPLNFREIAEQGIRQVTYMKRNKKETVSLDGPLFVYDFCSDSFETFTQDIAKYLDKRGQEHDTINPTIRSKIIFGIASIMKTLHSKGIIYRDLKLENVCLDENNEPLLFGFYLAKYMTNSIEMSMAIGSPVCMAPELFLDGDETYDLSVDVFSYAIFLYKIFSNKIEFEDTRIRSSQQYMMKIGRGMRPRRPSEIPDHYWELIQKCWKHDPSERPTFEEIVNILKDDKYALEEYGMKTDLENLHEYQERIENQI